MYSWRKPQWHNKPCVNTIRFQISCACVVTLNCNAVVLLFCWNGADLLTSLHMHKVTPESARKFSSPQHILHTQPFTLPIYMLHTCKALRRTIVEKLNILSQKVCYTLMFEVKTCTQTYTYTGKHTSTDLIAAAWVILSLEVGSGCSGEGFGEGSLCRVLGVGVYIFI